MKNDVTPKSWTNQLEGVNMKFKDEEKKRMLEEVLLGNQNMRKVSRKYGISYCHLRDYVLRARKHGIQEVLHKTAKKDYSLDFKLEVVREVQNGGSQKGAAITYNISQPLVRDWCLKYAEKGIEGLHNVRRQKMLKDDRPEADSPKKKRFHTEKEYQELEKRLRYAEMENEFLKKLNALVQERIERERRK